MTYFYPVNSPWQIQLKRDLWVWHLSVIFLLTCADSGSLSALWSLSPVAQLEPHVGPVLRPAQTHGKHLAARRGMWWKGNLHVPTDILWRHPRSHKHIACHTQRRRVRIPWSGTSLSWQGEHAQSHQQTYQCQMYFDCFIFLLKHSVWVRHSEVQCVTSEWTFIKQLMFFCL